MIPLKYLECAVDQYHSKSPIYSSYSSYLRGPIGFRATVYGLGFRAGYWPVIWIGKLETKRKPGIYGLGL